MKRRNKHISIRSPLHFPVCIFVLFTFRSRTKVPMRRMLSFDMRFQRSSSQTIALATLPQRVKGAFIQDPKLNKLPIILSISNKTCSGGSCSCTAPISFTSSGSLGKKSDFVSSHRRTTKMALIIISTHGSERDGPVPSHKRMNPLGVSRRRRCSGIGIIAVTAAVRSPGSETSALPL